MELLIRGSCKDNSVCCCRTPVVESLPPGGGVRGDAMPDVAEYLQEIPLDWLSDAANLLSQTLRFGVNSELLIENNSVSAMRSDNSKPVRIPPGQWRCHKYMFVLLWYVTAGSSNVW